MYLLCEIIYKLTHKSIKQQSLSLIKCINLGIIWQLIDHINDYLIDFIDS